MPMSILTSIVLSMILEWNDVTSTSTKYLG